MRVYLLVSLMLKNKVFASACVRNPVGQRTSAVALALALSGTGHAADSVLPVTVVTASRFEQSIEEVVSTEFHLMTPRRSAQFLLGQ